MRTSPFAPVSFAVNGLLKRREAYLGTGVRALMKKEVSSLVYASKVCFSLVLCVRARISQFQQS